MKKIFIFIALSLILTSCGTYTQIYSSVLDYRPYTENGFFISPNPYPEAHQPVGEIYITVYPGSKEVKQKATNSRFSDPLYTTPQRSSKSPDSEITEDKLLEMCVQKAVDMGANGISNFKCQIVYNITKTQYGNLKSIDRYEVSGLGIKIQ